MIKGIRGILKRGAGAGHCDFPLTVMVTVLVIFGVVMIFSASYYYSINMFGTPYQYLKDQIFNAGLGFVLMWIASKIDYRIFRRLAFPILILSIVLLLLIFTPLGETRNGATRWLNFGISVMPGELAKPAIIVFASAYFATNMKRAATLRGMLPIIGVAGLMFVLIYLQPNLSTALTVVIIAAGIIFLSGMPWKVVIGAVILGVAGVLVIIIGGGSYQFQRLTSFLDPFSEAQGDGFQVVQSLLALGTGGFTGLGLGKSVQKNLYLPEAQTDFILSVIGEELGFLGILFLLVLFVLLIWRTMYIGMNAADRFGTLVCGGVAVMTGIQVIFNVAVVTSSMPPTGVAMPFISYGGNALWIFMGLYGIVLNISRTADISPAGEKLSEEGKGVGRRKRKTSGGQI